MTTEPQENLCLPLVLHAIDSRYTTYLRMPSTLDIWQGASKDGLVDNPIPQSEHKGERKGGSKLTCGATL